MKRYVTQRLPERMLLALTILSCGLALSAEPPAHSGSKMLSAPTLQRAQVTRYHLPERVAASRSHRPGR
ncbi:hypothetical protein [Geomonas sp.]|uniref:hypothetical protein n=1 Tax=Geomonas sp. TaxID=2651584 RepID=UPI002B4835D3|nr:hypothetical protein [Geomonas sp.]HJV33880.1 hypothetical protein [Geomonas sp.]